MYTYRSDWKSYPSSIYSFFGSQMSFKTNILSVSLYNIIKLVYDWDPRQLYYNGSFVNFSFSSEHTTKRWYRSAIIIIVRLSPLAMPNYYSKRSNRYFISGRQRYRPPPIHYHHNNTIITYLEYTVLYTCYNGEETRTVT